MLVPPGEEGKQHMTYLGQIVREVQRDAAALPTGALRTEIQVSLDVLTAVIDHLQSIRPGAGNLEETIGAAGDVMSAALTTALYVRELTSRPPERFARVRLSFN
jgi:hypothetical protein